MDTNCVPNYWQRFLPTTDERLGDHPILHLTLHNYYLNHFQNNDIDDIHISSASQVHVSQDWTAIIKLFVTFNCVRSNVVCMTVSRCIALTVQCRHVSCWSNSLCWCCWANWNESWFIFFSPGRSSLFRRIASFPRKQRRQCCVWVCAVRSCDSSRERFVCYLCKTKYFCGKIVNFTLFLAGIINKSWK